MNPFEEFCTEEVFIQTPDGGETRPRKCSISENKITFFDMSLDVTTSDRLLRLLPNGKAEKYDILDVTYSSGFDEIPPSWELTVRKHPGFVPLPTAPKAPNTVALPDTLVKPFDIFLSYSHADEALMTLVREHLVLYDRRGQIRKWWDRKLLPGTPLDGAITNYLSSSEIILLFVSASFLASDYCYDVEMQQALRQHAEGRSVVVPVILRHCGWQQAPFGGFLALPTDGRPLTAWPDRDEAAKNIADGVMRIVADLHAKRATQQ